MKKISRFARKRLTADHHAAGDSLLEFLTGGHCADELIGSLVRTYEGQRLGRLVHLRLSVFKRGLAELQLTSNATLRIHADVIRITANEILVPASYADELSCEGNVFAVARTAGDAPGWALAS